ncbi:hypothetical protein [Clostridium boliviensis]|uniref:hypothetical protein n=1 Tax=Clostridium boliviensis TaxID=318465 RepID=UPI002964CD58|nr:hypothetical protein [Clostridium boliviensis]
MEIIVQKVYWEEIKVHLESREYKSIYTTIKFESFIGVAKMIEKRESYPVTVFISNSSNRTFTLQLDVKIDFINVKRIINYEKNYG